MAKIGNDKGTQRLIDSLTVHPATAAAGCEIEFLWLIPITKEELEYKKKAGAEALEVKFEDAQFNYTDPFRADVV
jgi:hypothetical protein